jgi:hypothetical protein
LIVIATAQLMLVLDDTIANIALPSIQREMAVSAATLPWIINAYRCWCTNQGRRLRRGRRRE